MKSKKLIVSLLIIAIMISLMPTCIFAASSVKFSVVANVTEAHPGDEITYTVKMGAVKNIAGLKFKLVIPEGLTFMEGKAVDGLQAKLNAAKAEFTASTKVFIVGSSNYTSTTDTDLMTFKCKVNNGIKGNVEVKLVVDDEENIFDTEYNTITNELVSSFVNITIPSTNVSLNKNTLSLNVGQTENLTVTVVPTETTDEVVWTSSDSTKATVDNTGKVTAVAEGSATIKATATSGKSASCNVTVTKPACNHSSKTTVKENNATCTTDGNHKYFVCNNCKAVLKADGTTLTTVEAETVKALGHDFTVLQKDKTQHWYKCSRCNETSEKVAHESEEYLSDETYHWKVCECENIFDKSEHTPAPAVNENVVPATCAKDGSHDEVVYCSVCHYKLSSTSKTDKATGEHVAGTPVRENEVEATILEEGSYDEVTYCIYCEKELSREPKTTPKFVYEVIGEEEASNENSENGEITITVNGKFEKFEGIKVDGVLVDKSNYTAKSGSTIVTLKPEYLATLAKGEHKITFVYDDAEIDTSFKVVERNNPKTGDASTIAMYTMIVSGCFICGIMASLLKKSKENN